MRRPASQQVLDALATGPMTTRELAAELPGLEFNYIRAVVAEQRAHGRLHVKAWQREEEGGRLYPRAVYAMGPGKDAPRPAPLTKAEQNARHRARKAVRVASVWDLGLAVDHRRVGRALQ